MNDVAEEWLKSGKYAELASHKLRPIENPLLKGTPLAPVRGQAQAFFLIDDNNFDWILKKFSPAKIPDSAYIKAIQSLVPHRPGFQAGYLRRVLSKKDISKSGFHTAEFELWVENTVLMPRIKYDDWAALSEKIRDGSVSLANDERMKLCRSMSEQIGLLESNDLSHRDLSATNVFVDLTGKLVHFIDWDCLFHPSLSMPPNTTFGTEGYIAPFVKNDPRLTWELRADRFSLAILNAEFLSMNAGSAFAHDGGMFNQAELDKGVGPETARIISDLRKNFPGADILLEKALLARSFDDCPSPVDWLALSSPNRVVFPPLASPQPQRATAQPNVALPVNPGAFALLDETAFVQLDSNLFVPLL